MHAFVRRALWVGAGLSTALGGCRRSEVSPPRDGGLDALPAPTSSESPRPAPTLASSAADAPTLEPPLPPFERGMMDHAHHAGWAPDGSDFGYCVRSGGSGETKCTFSQANGKTTRLSDFDRDAGEPDAGVTAELERKLSGYVSRAPSWPYARDLQLTWEVLGAHSPTGAESPRREPPVLRVGARVRGTKEAAWPIRIVAREPAYTIHAEAIELSPDARELAVLSHDFAGEFSDHFELRFYATAALASQAYNVGGLELHRAGAYAKAAELFRAAAALDTKSALPLYNLACALTRLGDVQARQTLELAIARGGDSIRRKAERDADFDAVRTGWLADVLKPRPATVGTPH